MAQHAGTCWQTQHAGNTQPPQTRGPLGTGTLCQSKKGRRNCHSPFRDGRPMRSPPPPPWMTEPRLPVEAPPLGRICFPAPEGQCLSSGMKGLLLPAGQLQAATCFMGGNSDRSVRMLRAPGPGDTANPRSRTGRLGWLCLLPVNCFL